MWNSCSCTCHQPEKKDPLRGSFFSYRPSAGTAPSAQHAFGALRLRRAPLPTGSPLRPARCPIHNWIDAYPRIALGNRRRIWTIDILFQSGNVGLTHFLMKHLERSGNQKKKTRFAGLFFLTGLRPVLPLGQCSLSKSAALHPKRLHKSLTICNNCRLNFKNGIAVWSSGKGLLNG